MLTFLNRLFIIFSKTLCSVLSQIPVEDSHKNSGNKNPNRVTLISESLSNRSWSLLGLITRFRVRILERAFYKTLAIVLTVDTCFV